MTVDRNLIPFVIPGTSYEVVRNSGDLGGTDYRRVGLWTVPDNVRSFTLLLEGARSAGTPPNETVIQGLFYDIPCSPGQVWATEPGRPDAGYTATTYNAANGGDGGGERLTPGGGPGGVDYSVAGKAASLVSLRTGGEQLLAVAGGEGGWVELFFGTGTDWPSGPGDITIGGLRAMSGWSDGGSAIDLTAGGGGGGWPGGSAGPGFDQPGVSGGNYLPCPVGGSVGGPQSPRWEDLFDESYSPPGFLALPHSLISIYYEVTTPRGWTLGGIGVG